MNITAKMLFTAAGFLLFISAAVSGIGLFRENHQALGEVNAVMDSRDRNLVVMPVIEEEERISGSAVMQSIFQIAELGADIQVDGYLFSKDVIIEETDVSMIAPQAVYSTAYQRNGDGVLQRVIFRKQ
ncbi:hypothetical protein OIN60_00560 [Paenibacillus sp. P96]|uniref:Uncharacterized protein n=1 Tax=Paenibacillus zeirhizosphaerae TaxID=2987519 RepID=A0ABT9FKM3_9BACL|nr:hypothetical protein [Paenibacillus sp. P96]MDP4095283.1 hypothetical protein [Paenibacillus sp. P96]